MADFPPLPTTSLATLCEMFPTMQRSVVEMILENAQGDGEKAIELLLGMADDQNLPTPVVEPELSKTSLSYVSATLLSPRSSSAFPISTSPSLASVPKACTPPLSPLTVRQPSPLPTGTLADLQQGHLVFVILRGLPGSGKSSLATRLLSSAKLGVSFSTDDYFLKGGFYTFRADLLTEAHSWNQRRAMAAVKDRVRLVIIDNTNTMAWEMRPYIELALNNGYKIHILEPDTPWKFKPRILAGKNSHKVPKQKIELMLDRYEKNISLEKLKSMWNISEPYIDEGSDAHGQEEEIFESEEEAINEDSTSSDTPSSTPPSSSLLNPAVREFVPAVVQDGLDVLDDDVHDPVSDQYPDNHRSLPGGDCPDIERLVTMFPHLSIEQAITLYNQHGQQTREVISSLLETADTPESSDQETLTVPMALDPIFAVTLQEQFGSPVDDSLLQFLKTGEMLSMDIPISLARQIFTLWQSSLQSVLTNKPVLEASGNIGAAGGLAATAPAGPKTVLAPNAVEHYEKEMLDKAMKASLSNIPQKTKPVIVVRPMKQQQDTKDQEDQNNSDLDQFIEQRDMLYRKAMETRGSNMQGAASYYAAQARELNTHIKTTQKQSQMEMFLQANKDSPNTRLDLHYLQTSDAIKQLQQFISQKEATARSGSSGSQSVDVITGKGNRSENGKSRLRPAVQNWLDQKNYSYTEVNSGCFRVRIKSQ
eukprot:TRINITY_DN17898_c0_g1_i2.p1 TRINITY_DN17898_c0_g1~~TRINITY_DN17898_c0_g1_i2.p1  ORF type:complete len:706 (-),score=276.50 TRINITY_DN17898_c0_g1_i2:410-2527(-)